MLLETGDGFRNNGLHEKDHRKVSHGVEYFHEDLRKVWKWIVDPR